MAIVRWQPSRAALAPQRTLQDELECFFQDFFGTYDTAQQPRSFTPRVDLKDTPESFVIRAELPGVDKDALDLTVEAEHVVIKGERKEEHAEDNECYYCRESYGGTFERSIGLPQPVVADKAEAKLANGVLTLTLPKAQPRTSVKVAVN